jgi:DNA-binding transcriptional LysR family regulator
MRLVEHGSDRLKELLQAGEIDFAGLLLPISEEFSWHVIRREPLMALLSAAHQL